MSIWTCGLKAFGRKRTEQKMSAKDKNLVADRLQKLANDWSNIKSDRFRNVKDSKWNNFDTFEWLWEKYTHKPLSIFASGI